MPQTPSIVVPAAELQRVELSEAFERHRGDVYRWAMRYGAGDRAWAEDLTHDVFLKLHGHLSSLEARADLAGWLYTVTARLAMTRRRNERGWSARLAAYFKPQREAALDEQVAARQATRSAMAQLAALPDRERVVLCMELLDGKKQRDIASALGLSEGHVSKLLKRARERIRIAGWKLDEGAE
ncbi:MAG: sigma-70 family RNA polymerase sigma factor [Myxococcaceae bacterium]|nr:sigma-70 family RNA polymerase sigma factor [Myxococcaceae bacterium]